MQVQRCSRVHRENEGGPQRARAPEPPPPASRGDLVLVVVAAFAAAGSGVLPSDATGAPAGGERARQREVNVLFRVSADTERRDVADLTAKTNVTARMVDGLCQPLLEDLRLEAALHKLRAREPEHEVEVPLRVEEQPVAHHATQERLSMEDAVIVLLVFRQQLTSRRAHLRQHVLPPPNFAL